MPIFAGCDIGSTTGKIVLMDENKTILGSSIVRSAHGPQATADHAMELALADAKLPKDIKIDYLVSTGYGRTNIKGMNEDISEISCHARGVHHFNSAVRTVIDIGGQDCKVISLSKSGRVQDFQMNDKCSAGTGRFFEVMTRVLDCSFEELANAALKSTSLSDFQAVFRFRRERGDFAGQQQRAVRRHQCRNSRFHCSSHQRHGDEGRS